MVHRLKVTNYSVNPFLLNWPVIDFTPGFHAFLAVDGKIFIMAAESYNSQDEQAVKKNFYLSLMPVENGALHPEKSCNFIPN